MISPGSTDVLISFVNTASEGSGTDMWFDVEAAAPYPTTEADIGNIPNGTTGKIEIKGLRPLHEYSFRLWARDDNPQGCRSGRPTQFITVYTFKGGSDITPAALGAFAAVVQLGAH